MILWTGYAAVRRLSTHLTFMRRGEGAALNGACAYAIVIRMAEQTHTSSVLSVRVSPRERALLEAAAEQSRTTLSDFMRRKAVDAAEAEMSQQGIVTIPAKDWEAFEAWVNRPAEAVPALAELASRIPSWER